jgi:LmbE family N-acetylglucosaminyl deacetylase
VKIDLGKTLIISPHADDWFLGCTSIIKKGAGCVLILSTWDGEQQEILEELNQCWTRVVDKTGWEHKLLAFPARRFDKHVNELRETVYRYVVNLKPSAILVPAGRHPDHVITAREVDAATIHLNIALLYYYCDLLDRHPNPNIYSYLSAADMVEKQDTWRQVWKTQQYRVEKPETLGMRRDKPQLDELERFYLIRGEGEWLNDV